MPKEFGRNKRVADQIQREIAEIIQREQSDTGLQLVTVSYVDLSPDLKYAKVFVTSLDARERSEVIDILNDFAGHFRHLLSRRLTMRSVPRLKFLYDDSIERGTHISALIDSLHSGRDDND